jgi:hypothetical protein
MKKVKFSLLQRKGERSCGLPVTGYGFTHKGIDLVAHTMGVGCWQVSEPMTGLYVVLPIYKTRRDAIEAASALLDRPHTLELALKLTEEKRNETKV